MAEPLTIKLSTPVQFGKDSDPITELVLKPSARAFKDCEIPMREDGTVVFKPYDLARVGVRLAGHPNPVVDLLDPADMMEVATAVMGFLGTSPKIGTVPSR